jgi:hypothetical protein
MDPPTVPKFLRLYIPIVGVQSVAGGVRETTIPRSQYCRDTRLAADDPIPSFMRILSW